jgi:hypothetical protein
MDDDEENEPRQEINDKDDVVEDNEIWYEVDDQEDEEVEVDNDERIRGARQYRVIDMHRRRQIL